MGTEEHRAARGAVYQRDGDSVVAALGGADTDLRLRGWYASIDVEIESSGEAIVPDIWKWLIVTVMLFLLAEMLTLAWPQLTKREATPQT